MRVYPRDNSDKVHYFKDDVNSSETIIVEIASFYHFQDFFASFFLFFGLLSSP